MYEVTVKFYHERCISENGLQEIHIPLREMEHDTEDG
jgi:hypothetical protein